MSFLSPLTALIAAGITIPALVALYFLKLRRREMVVPSTMLWRKTIEDMQVNAPFQKLRKSLLLLLQLLLLTALLLAMARPTTRATTRPGQRVVIILDHSGSMNATDGDKSGDTRLSAAKAAADRLIDTLGDAGDASANARGTSGGAMVVSFAQRPRVRQSFTNDPAKLRAAVDGIAATDERSVLEPALRLIEPYAAQAGSDPKNKLVVYVLSDGRIDPSGGEGLALPGAELRFVRFGGGGKGGQASADNLGIVSMSARRGLETPEKVDVFARVINSGDAAVTSNLVLRVDGQVAQVQRVTVPGAKTAAASGASGGTSGGGEGKPGDTSAQFQFVLPGSAMVELGIDRGDLWAADNTARLVLAPARRLRVLLVTRGNAFLDRVIRSTRVRELVTMDPQRYEDQDPDLLRRGGWDAAGTSGGSGQGFDVIVFDAYAPKAAPPVASLYLGGAPPVKGLAIHKTEENDPAAQVFLDWKRDDPLMRYVVLDDVVLSKPGRLVVPEDAKVLATGQSGPLIAEVRANGAMQVVTSFDVLSTNWPLYVSFPVFMSNALETLGLGVQADRAGLAYRTGQVASVPTGQPTGDELRYTGPVTLTGRVREGEAALEPFTQAGVYEASDRIDPPYDTLAVNVLAPGESDLRPVGILAVGTVEAKGQAQARTIRHEIWPWFVWAALIFLGIEWLVYTRRMAV